MILYYYGGVYVDHDLKPLRNIEPLLRTYKCVLSNGFRNGYNPSNSFMASVKGFDLFKDYIDAMNDIKVSKQHVLDATGPSLLKKIFRKYLKIPHYSRYCKLYEKEYFHPISNDTAKGTLEELIKNNPKCYMLHGYAFSWKAMQ